MRTIFLLSLLVMTMAVAVNATDPACSTYTVVADCYTARATCHYNVLASTCANNAPATCEERYLDTVGCTAASSTCGINPFNNQCYTLTVTQRLQLDLGATKTAVQTSIGAVAGAIGGLSVIVSVGYYALWNSLSISYL